MGWVSLGHTKWTHGQLWVDPRGGIVLQTELDDHAWWTTVVERRSSEVLSTELTDDGPVCHALSVHLRRAKSITRFEAEEKFSKSGVLDKFPRRKYPCFCRYANFLLTQCRIGRRKLTWQNQLDSFSRFDRTPTCDRQTYRQTYIHRQTDTGP